MCVDVCGNCVSAASSTGTEIGNYINRGEIYAGKKKRRIYLIQQN